MGGLELRFLGDFEVRRDGQALPLPPSKKTRALLAYLALQPRRFRREQLCGLLWELPDDPRGSLRWSLSKLRQLVDDGEHPRIVAVNGLQHRHELRRGLHAQLVELVASEQARP